MIKKLLLILFSIFIFAQAAFTQEVFKVTSVNFDTSNALIFLTSPDGTTESIMKNVKLTKLLNPKRVYFDINSAVLTAEVQNWVLNSGGIKQVKVNQFSTKPNKIRVVLYLDEDFDLSKINFLRVNNNLVIKLKDIPNESSTIEISDAALASSEYFQNTYRDEKQSSSDFYENLSISNEELDKMKTAVNISRDISGKEDVLNQIQQSFNVPAVSPVGTKSEFVQKTEKVKKELRLKSKYYVNLVSTKAMGQANSILINGFGVIGLEKPMYLTNPSRVVYDIPNAVINPEILNQEFKIGQDTIRVGQFEPNKARIVITSLQPDKYFPIFSTDGQTVLFVNSNNFDYTTLFTKTNDAISYEVKKSTGKDASLINEFIISFSSPVVHSIKRDASMLTINFYNTLCYNDKVFRNEINSTDLSDMNIDLLPKVGLKLTLPLLKDTLVTCYLGADGKSMKLVTKNIGAKKTSYWSEKDFVLPKGHKPLSKCSVVIDAGHGGSDYGAMRSGINEKDINLDIARRVQAILSSKGVSVAMTRDADETITLQDRTMFCAGCCPDVFVSTHVNSSLKPDISGIETHYYHQQSYDLAQTVHASLISEIRAKDRGLFKSKFYVINHTEVPAILVEIGFMSNDGERSDLVTEERKQKTAQAIADGILRYLGRK